MILSSPTYPFTGKRKTKIGQHNFEKPPCFDYCKMDRKNCPFNEWGSGSIYHGDYDQETLKKQTKNANSTLTTQIKNKKIRWTDEINIDDKGIDIQLKDGFINSADAQFTCWGDGSGFEYDNIVRNVIGPSSTMQNIYDINSYKIEHTPLSYGEWNAWVQKAQYDYRFGRVSDLNAETVLFPNVDNPWKFTEYVYKGIGKNGIDNINVTIPEQYIVQPPLYDQSFDLINPTVIDEEQQKYFQANGTDYDGKYKQFNDTLQSKPVKQYRQIQNWHAITKYDELPIDESMSQEQKKARYEYNEKVKSHNSKFLDDTCNDVGVRLYCAKIPVQSVKWGEHGNIPPHQLEMTAPVDFLDSSKAVSTIRAVYNAVIGAPFRGSALGVIWWSTVSQSQQAQKSAVGRYQAYSFVPDFVQQRGKSYEKQGQEQKVYKKYYSYADGSIESTILAVPYQETGTYKKLLQPNIIIGDSSNENLCHNGCQLCHGYSKGKAGELKCVYLQNNCDDYDSVKDMNDFFISDICTKSGGNADCPHRIPMSNYTLIATYQVKRNNYNQNNNINLNSYNQALSMAASGSVAGALTGLNIVTQSNKNPIMNLPLQGEEQVTYNITYEPVYLSPSRPSLNKEFKDEFGRGIQINTDQGKFAFDSQENTNVFKGGDTNVYNDISTLNYHHFFHSVMHCASQMYCSKALGINQSQGFSLQKRASGQQGKCSYYNYKRSSIALGCPYTCTPKRAIQFCEVAQGAYSILDKYADIVKYYVDNGIITITQQEYLTKYRKLLYMPQGFDETNATQVAYEKKQWIITKLDGTFDRFTLFFIKNINDNKKYDFAFFIFSTQFSNESICIPNKTLHIYIIVPTQITGQVQSDEKMNQLQSLQGSGFVGKRTTQMIKEISVLLSDDDEYFLNKIIEQKMGSFVFTGLLSAISSQKSIIFDLYKYNEESKIYQRDYYEDQYGQKIQKTEIRLSYGYDIKNYYYWYCPLTNDGKKIKELETCYNLIQHVDESGHWLCRAQKFFAVPTTNCVIIDNEQKFLGGWHPEYKDYSKRGPEFIQEKIKDEQKSTGSGDYIVGTDSGQLQTEKVGYWTDESGEYIIDQKLTGVDDGETKVAPWVSRKGYGGNGNAMCISYSMTNTSYGDDKVKKPIVKTAAVYSNDKFENGEFAWQKPEDKGSGMEQFPNYVDEDGNKYSAFPTIMHKDLLPAVRTACYCEQCNYYIAPRYQNMKCPWCGKTYQTVSGIKKFFKLNAIGNVDVWAPAGTAIKTDAYFWRRPSQITNVLKNQLQFTAKYACNQSSSTENQVDYNSNDLISQSETFGNLNGIANNFTLGYQQSIGTYKEIPKYFDQKLSSSEQITAYERVKKIPWGDGQVLQDRMFNSTLPENLYPLMNTTSDQGVIAPYSSKINSGIRMVNYTEMINLRNKIQPLYAYFSSKQGHSLNKDFPTYRASYEDRTTQDQHIIYKGFKPKIPFIVFATTNGHDSYQSYNSADDMFKIVKQYFPTGYTWWYMKQLMGGRFTTHSLGYYHMDEANYITDYEQGYGEMSGGVRPSPFTLSDRTVARCMISLYGVLPLDKQILGAYVIFDRAGQSLTKFPIGIPFKQHHSSAIMYHHCHDHKIQHLNDGKPIDIWTYGTYSHKHGIGFDTGIYYDEQCVPRNAYDMGYSYSSEDLQYQDYGDFNGYSKYSKRIYDDDCFYQVDLDNTLSGLCYIKDVTFYQNVGVVKKEINEYNTQSQGQGEKIIGYGYDENSFTNLSDAFIYHNITLTDIKSKQKFQYVVLDQDNDLVLKYPNERIWKTYTKKQLQKQISEKTFTVTVGISDGTEQGTEYKSFRTYNTELYNEVISDRSQQIDGYFDMSWANSLGEIGDSFSVLPNKSNQWSSPVIYQNEGSDVSPYSGGGQIQTNNGNVCIDVTDLIKNIYEKRIARYFGGSFGKSKEQIRNWKYYTIQDKGIVNHIYEEKQGEQVCKYNYNKYAKSEQEIKNECLSDNFSYPKLENLNTIPENTSDEYQIADYPGQERIVSCSSFLKTIEQKEKQEQNKEKKKKGQEQEHILYTNKPYCKEDYTINQWYFKTYNNNSQNYVVDLLRAPLCKSVRDWRYEKPQADYSNEKCTNTNCKASTMGFAVAANMSGKYFNKQSNACPICGTLVQKSISSGDGITTFDYDAPFSPDSFIGKLKIQLYSEQDMVCDFRVSIRENNSSVYKTILDVSSDGTVNYPKSRNIEFSYKEDSKILEGITVDYDTITGQDTEIQLQNLRGRFVKVQCMPSKTLLEQLFMVSPDNFTSSGSQIIRINEYELVLSPANEQEDFSQITSYNCFYGISFPNSEAKIVSVSKISEEKLRVVFDAPVVSISSGDIIPLNVLRQGGIKSLQILGFHYKTQYSSDAKDKDGKETNSGSYYLTISKEADEYNTSFDFVSNIYQLPQVPTQILGVSVGKSNGTYINLKQAYYEGDLKWDIVPIGHDNYKIVGGNYYYDVNKTKIVFPIVGVYQKSGGEKIIVYCKDFQKNFEYLGQSYLPQNLSVIYWSGNGKEIQVSASAIYFVPQNQRVGLSFEDLQSIGTPLNGPSCLVEKNAINTIIGNITVNDKQLQEGNGYGNSCPLIDVNGNIKTVPLNLACYNNQPSGLSIQEQSQTNKDIGSVVKKNAGQFQLPSVTDIGIICGNVDLKEAQKKLIDSYYGVNGSNCQGVCKCKMTFTGPPNSIYSGGFIVCAPKQTKYNIDCGGGVKMSYYEKTGGLENGFFLTQIAPTSIGNQDEVGGIASITYKMPKLLVYAKDIDHYQI